MKRNDRNQSLNKYKRHLSRTEMYDYKNKVKELMKENLKEHLDRKIRELEANLDCKNIDYMQI